VNNDQEIPAIIIRTFVRTIEKRLKKQLGLLVVISAVLGNSLYGVAQEPVDWSHSHKDINMAYVTWDGSLWTATLQGNGFMHTPHAAGKAHFDTVIAYKTWDGSNWTARIENGQFIHAPNGDFTHSHTAPVIAYITWNGDKWAAKLAFGEITQFEHAPVPIDHLEINCGLVGPHHAEASCMSMVEHAVCGCDVTAFWGKAHCGCEPGTAYAIPAPVEHAAIKEFTISPSEIMAGQTTTFTIILDRPAPAGGINVAFSSVTNTGLTDSIVDLPTAMFIRQGAASESKVVRTQRATWLVTNILFKAQTWTTSKNANLIIH
jgi:hypothetical protein